VSERLGRRVLSGLFALGPAVHRRPKFTPVRYDYPWVQRVLAGTFGFDLPLSRPGRSALSHHATGRRTDSPSGTSCEHGANKGSTLDRESRFGTRPLSVIGPVASPDEDAVLDDGEIHVLPEPPIILAPMPVSGVVRRRKLAPLYALCVVLLVFGGVHYANVIANRHVAQVAVLIPPVAGDPSSGFTPPFGAVYLPSTVDGGGSVGSRRDVHISAIDYANSTTFYCPTSGLIDWDVAGYSTFAAEYGIPDDAQSATGVANTITFTDQNGKTLDVQTTSIGQPVKISFSVSGVDRLIMSCARQGSNNATNNLVALGNALLAQS